MDYQYPIEWDDELLVAEFFDEYLDEKADNSTYRSKMKFWKRAIELYCEQINKISFTPSDIKQRYKKNSLVPQCVDSIIRELLQKDKLISTDTFLKQDISKSWGSEVMNIISVVPSIISTALTWLVKVKSDSDFENEKEETPFVLPNCPIFLRTILSKKSLQLLNSFDISLSTHSSIITMNEMNKNLTECKIITDIDISLCLKYLTLSNSIIIFKSSNDTICFKILNNNEQKSNLKSSTKTNLVFKSVSELDKTIADLKCTLSLLKTRKNELENKVATKTKTIRNLMQNNQKEEAKLILSLKKKLDNQIEKTDSLFLNIEHTLLRLDSSENSEEFIQAMTQARKTLASQVNIDSVDNLKDDMEDLFLEQDQINSIMGQPLVDDMNELEKELELITEKSIIKEDNNLVKCLSDKNISIPKKTVISNDIDKPNVTPHKIIAV